GGLAARAAPASALEPRTRLDSLGEVWGQHLDRDASPEGRVARAIHLAHAARAERGDDRVGTETGAGRQRHDDMSAPERPPDLAGGVAARGPGEAVAGVGPGAAEEEAADRGAVAGALEARPGGDT